MKLYSTREFAEAAGISVQTVKHHVYRSGRLTPQTVAGQLVFTEDDLARFLAWRAEKTSAQSAPPAEKLARRRAQQASHMRSKRKGEN